MRFERYSISVSREKVIVQMRQQSNGFAMIIVSMLFLGASWWFSPYGVTPRLPQLFSWIIFIFFGIILCFSVIAALYSEKFLFTPDKVEYRNTFGEIQTLQYTSTLQICIRAASPQARRSGTRVFPYEIIILGEDKTESEIVFLFQSKPIAREFMQALSQKVPLKLADIIQDDFFNEKRLADF